VTQREKKIPPRIIRFWHDRATLPAEYREAMEESAPHSEGMELLFVDDAFMHGWLPEAYPFVHDVYRRTRVESIRSDLARLTLLHRYGGIYMDMSIRLRAPIYPLVDPEAEVVLLRRDDQGRYARYPEQAHIGAMILTAMPGSPFIACALSHLVDTLVRGHYNHHILFAATKYTDDTYIRWLDTEPRPPVRFGFFSFKALKARYLDHIRTPKLANSWRAHETDGIFDPDDLAFLQRGYSRLPCPLWDGMNRGERR